MNEAWGYRTQAVNSRNNARMARFGGKQASRNTYLTTAASLAGQAYGGYQSGAFSGGGGSAPTGATGGTAFCSGSFLRGPNPPLRRSAGAGPGPAHRAPLGHPPRAGNPPAAGGRRRVRPHSARRTGHPLQPT